MRCWKWRIGVLSESALPGCQPMLSESRARPCLIGSPSFLSRLCLTQESDQMDARTGSHSLNDLQTADLCFRVCFLPFCGHVLRNFDQPDPTCSIFTVQVLWIGAGRGHVRRQLLIRWPPVDDCLFRRLVTRCSPVCARNFCFCWIKSWDKWAHRALDFEKHLLFHYLFAICSTSDTNCNGMKAQINRDEQ